MTTATTLAAASRTITNLQQRENDDNGVLQTQDVCYRCGQPGHIAKHCRVPVYKYGEAPTMATEQYDNTQQWFEDPHGFDGTTWDIKDKTCNIDHNNLHCQHQMPQRQQTIHQQSRLFLEYVTMSQSWLHMYKKAMQNKQQVQSTLWSTVEQPHMFAHHGLHKSFQYNNYQQEMDHNYAQSQTMRSNSMDTNGFTCKMLKDNHLSYHFITKAGLPS